MTARRDRASRPTSESEEAERSAHAPPDLLALRQAAHTATSAYTRAHNMYWASPHEERTYRTCQETAARLDATLTALLAYLESLRGYDLERERMARQQAVMRRDVALVEERAQLAVQRANTR